MTVCRISQEWANPEYGSGPFKTSLEVDVPASTSELVDAMEAWEAWWESATTFIGYFDAGLGVSTLTGTGVFGGVVFEHQIANLSAPTGLDPELGGVSARAIKLGNRPEGGRRGSMFWPGLENSAHSSSGALVGSTAADLNAGLETLLSDLEASAVGLTVVQSHNVAGDTSTTVVTGFDIAPTVSFLNRRYR